MTAEPGTYTARPVDVQAMQFTRDTWPHVNEWLRAELGPGKYAFQVSGRKISLSIATREGPRACPAGYWIIRGTAGEFYPVHPDVFDAKYDQAASVPGGTVIALPRRTES
jgi:hypothetical protein